MRDWLRMARLDRGLSQEKMAELLDLSPTYYSLMENNKRQKAMSIPMADKISKALNVPLDLIVTTELSDRAYAEDAQDAAS